MGGFGAPRGGAGFGRDAASCYNCNKPGHIARDCPDSGNKTCYNCGKAGHISRDCDVGGGSSSMMGSIGGAGRRDCYSCGKPGHISRDCPDGGFGGRSDNRKCYACGGFGHISRDCTSQSGSVGGSGSHHENDDEYR